MRKMKRLRAIMVVAALASFGAPQAFAGVMETGKSGIIQNPGPYGDIDTPAATGEIGMPGVAGDMSGPGATGDMNYPVTSGDMNFPVNGWMSTGLYAAIASLFG